MPLTHATDTELLRRFRDAGDRGALAEVFARHHALAYRVALGVLGSAADAEDAAQDAFLALVTYAPRLHDGESITGLVARMALFAARRIVRASSRRRRRETAWSLEALEGGRCPQEAATQRETMRQALAALQGMGEAYRAPVVLHYIHGLSTEETATALHLSPGATRMRLSRAVARLRERFAEAGVGLSIIAAMAVLADRADAQPVPATLAPRLEQIASQVALPVTGGLLVAASPLLVKLGLVAVTASVLTGAVFLAMRTPMPVGQGAPTITTVAPPAPALPTPPTADSRSARPAQTQNGTPLPRARAPQVSHTRAAVPEAARPQTPERSPEMNVPRAVIAAGVAATMALPVGATRFDSFTQRFANNPDQAKVVAAGYLGGAGTEWLVGGGFQPDGTVVLVGTALGPTLEIAGTTARALGADMAALAEVKQATDPRNPAKTLPMGWAHENATAFVVRLSPDLKTVRSVVRFPWKSAGATSAAVDEQGAIYLAGVAGEGFAMAFPDAQVSPVDLEKIGPTTVPTRTIYLAKMAPDGGKAEWLRTMTGPSNAPVVDVDAAGLLRLQGPDVRCFDTAGALKQTAIVPGGMTTRNAVSPADGSFCYAHEHNWPTGREPWRCPVLKVYDKDGALQHHLYDWGGPFVGLGEMRLVSDTAIRAATYDKDGNLIITLWSDGGNSVALREPMDVYRVSPNIKGLGMSSWGAGVLSLAYIIKLDGKTFRVASGTIWSAYLKDRDKPNSIWVDAMGFGAEGSTLMGGRSATGLIQTGNNLNPYTKADPTVVPSGTYVAVMGPDFASLRFSSGMPNCGATDLANGKPWAFRTGTVNGKPLALVMGGATGKNADGYTAPMVNPLQPAFGGGLTDGHVLVLDLSQAQ